MKSLFRNIIFLVGHYLLSLFFFFAFRIILFFSQKDFGALSTDWNLIKKAFKIGFQFDSVVTGYLLTLPLLILLFSPLFKNHIRVYKIVWWLFKILILLAFAISFTDIPYFNYNFARVSVVIFSWLSDYEIVFSMIAQEPTYIVYFFIFIATYLIYRFVSKKILKATLKFDRNINVRFSPLLYSLGMLLMIFFLFLATRGRIDSPIRINHAFFCNNSFYNQLGLNPNFTLIKSLKQNSAIQVMENDLALKLTQQYLNTEHEQSTENPILRKIKSDSTIIDKNIVLVIMESMSTHKMGCYGNPDMLTPFLDSLAQHALLYKNIYSAGRHTCDGIFSTLYSYPTILRERPMSALEKTKYSSLPEVFKQNNYTNIYSTTHSETFDNVGVFLPENDFDTIVSQSCYDSKYVQSGFGVPDHILFKYGIETMDDMHQKQKKFFSALMTISDHGPYIIPENIDFKSGYADIKKQIVQYADWSIRQFFKEASSKPWFKESVFVFVADHGAVNERNTYEVPLSLHHVPLLIYSPDTTLFKAQKVENFGTQMDILPTIAGMLNMSYTNNTYGKNLLKTEQEYAFFSSDDKLACIGPKYYYIYKLDGSEALYEYHSKSTENLATKLNEKTKEMRDYVLSMTQSAKWMMDHKKTEIK